MTSELLLPREMLVGTFAAQFPSGTFAMEARNGSLVGTARVTLGFVREDAAYVDYVETYGPCEIRATNQ
jgi:hypothetical protein